MIRHVFGFVCEFAEDIRGATAVEYALLGTGIAVVIVGAVSTLAGSMGSTFSLVGGSL